MPRGRKVLFAAARLLSDLRGLGEKRRGLDRYYTTESRARRPAFRFALGGRYC
ncbi:MAG: hypothetical protein MUD06_10240 [Rhodospirillales bacterium]|jgi:hypothetical protein|nr:hypothetical protein [Rhodospirillales bacterium]